MDSECSESHHRSKSCHRHRRRCRRFRFLRHRILLLLVIRFDVVHDTLFLMFVDQCFLRFAMLFVKTERRMCSEVTSGLMNKIKKKKKKKNSPHNTFFLGGL